MTVSALCLQAELPVPCRLFRSLRRWMPTHGAAGFGRCSFNRPCGRLPFAIAARLGGPLQRIVGQVPKPSPSSTGYQLSPTQPSDAALNGSANCLWPTSAASEVAATERFGWYCIASANRVKQSLTTPSCVRHGQALCHLKVAQTHGSSLFSIKPLSLGPCT